MRINDTRYGFYSYHNQANRFNIKQSSKNTPTSTEVEISSRGREMAEAMKFGQTERQNRVQELKQQIAAGTYHVDSKKIAEKMIDFWNNHSK
ncbi:flagellar biosynthesis anti-sigma factor FlgM [Neobacillus sedimentimangrovi]|uniref:Negative regulator of flagellin synthesis n=1 Tax=Neobacillus sedimentimangrovi TaxID=2699460 RepID=A0ABS8QK77_9BACI|nr:flagellar biosynthesis anti-sigma factor FlgM [Neobacillus sedimentimangrovi]MCD4839687.1 flagellar biosynthesis anti-sigma factor FlgM [Neobacillus sedimentimangrovi]